MSSTKQEETPLTVAEARAILAVEKTLAALGALGRSGLEAIRLDELDAKGRMAWVQLVESARSRIAAWSVK
jgi:hypothetical protein